MKKITILKIFLYSGTLLLTLAGCNNKTEEEKASLENLPTNKGVVYTDTVSLQQAQRDIQHYLSSCDSLFNDTVPIRSYSINKSDILGILGVTSVPDCTFDHCRVYIGLTDENKFKLYMTPTVLKPDPDNPKTSIYMDTILSVNRHKFLYDLNAPCPSTCDKYSPLYKP
nr:hypothetical protein [uncultured Fluviicola sp.]